MNTLRKIGLIGVAVFLLGASSLLAACGSATPDVPTPTQLNPDLVFTAAAETAAAMMTEAAPPTATITPTATETQEPPTATTAPTEAAPTVSPTAALGGPSSSGDSMIFVEDVQVQDNDVFEPGEKFTKIWQVKNDGSTTWGSGFSLVFVGGNQMGGPASIAIPSEVAPGGTVNISVELTAPESAGEYIGYWRMSNDRAELFSNSIWVAIHVAGEGTPVATNTPGPSATPGGATATPTATQSVSSGIFSNVGLSVDSAEVSGTCPHNYVFTAGFTLSEAANVTYQLEVVSRSDNATLEGPDPVTTNVSAGSYEFTYNIEITNSLDGAATFHITSPVDLKSQTVNFSLECQ